MYKQYLKVSDNKVITTIQIPTNVPVCQFGGDIFSKDKIVHKYADMLEIGPDMYLGPSGDINDHIKHSCNPNCYLSIVGNRVILYSLYLISANSEITYDYSLSSTDTLDTWAMKCECKSFNCRKTISGLHYLDPKIQEEYKKRGMIPLFLSNPIFKKI